MRITSLIDTNGPSNPLMKVTAIVPGAWLTNFYNRPALWLLPFVAFLFAVLAAALRRRSLAAFLASALVPVCTIATAGVALFPFLLP